MTTERQPDCIAIVQQKRLSDKMSWCNYTNPASFYSQTKAARFSRDWGRPFRFIYRINVYMKGQAA